MKYLALLFSGFLFSQSVNQAKPFYIGHSLVNHNVPNMVHQLALSAGKTTSYNVQIINGAPLQWQYNNSSGAEGVPYTTGIPANNPDVLVLTEAIPLLNHINWSDSNGYADLFYKYFQNNSTASNKRYYLYETWHCTTTGTPTGCDYDNGDDVLWHPRLQSDLPNWTGILNHVKTQNPGSQAYLIPGGQAFYNLVTKINNSQLPGYTSFLQFFTDNIHLNNAGNYFIACVMYATIFKESPVGLPSNFNNQWGTPYTEMPTAAQAQIMQQTAWETVTNLSSYTGVTSSTLSTQNSAKNAVEIYPNPATDVIKIDGSVKNSEYQINDVSGKMVVKNTLQSKEISVSNLKPGVYILVLDGKSFKFIKK